MTILPVVLFDDVELWTTARLRALLTLRDEPVTDNVYIGNKVPATRRDRMIIVRDDGGNARDVVLKDARIGVRIWGKTEQEANDLARIVEALLRASPNGDPVSRVRPTSPVPIADDAAEFQRYLTAELTLTGRTSA